MKKDKVIRRIDELGRVVIPRDIRTEAGISCGDKIVFTVDGSRIIISKPFDNCVFCNSKYDLLEYNDKHVCRECLKLINAKYK